MLLPLFCAWARKVASGRSWDGESGVLLGEYGHWTVAGLANSLEGQRVKMLGCEPQKNKWYALVRLREWRGKVRK